MAKRHPPNHDRGAPDPAWREGHRRALELLRDLESTSINDTDREADTRDGRPQSNLVHGHLFALFASRNARVIEAFGAVLTHYMGTIASGGVPDIDGDHEHAMANVLRDPIPTRMAGKRARVPMRPFGESDLANG